MRNATDDLSRILEGYSFERTLMDLRFFYESETDTDLFLFHMMQHLHPRQLTGIGGLPRVTGIPAYDLEVAYARRMNQQRFIDFSTEVIRGMTVSSWEAWCSVAMKQVIGTQDNPELWRAWFGSVYTSSIDLHSHGIEYRRAIAQTLRYANALRLGDVDWRTIDRYVPHASEESLILADCDCESFFKSAGLDDLYQVAHCRPLPCGTVR